MCWPMLGTGPTLDQGQGVCQCLDQDGDSVPTLCSRFGPRRDQPLLDIEAGAVSACVAGYMSPSTGWSAGQLTTVQPAALRGEDSVQSSRVRGKVTSSSACPMLSPGQAE